MLIAGLLVCCVCCCCCVPCTPHASSPHPRDINTVNGVPFPEMPLQPKTYRFRFLNSAVSRPWLLKIKNAKGVDIHQSICHVIAADGGYRSPAVPWPIEGLQMGVAERYEAVCDFSSPLAKGQKLYLWNGRNGEQGSICREDVCGAVPSTSAGKTLLGPTHPAQ